MKTTMVGKTVTVTFTPVGLTALIDETEEESGPEETEEAGEEEEEIMRR